MTSSAPLGALSSALLGRYTIEREVGSGGMATVYLAQDLRHDRRVALKVLRPELAAVIGAERFLAEIKTTANLQHPHILPLFDSGAAESFLFYVMPYVEGESLRDRITREKQLPVDEAVRVATQVLSAIDYAHRHGVVHRDIKPENILLHDGSALVADFGIALAVSTAGAGTRMTETGMSLGTPHYMSPEQAMGEREITAKSDVYALGCVLYEMLLGEPPFTGPTAQAIIARVVTEDPRSLSVQRKTIPPHVEAAVRKSLQKLPADRFKTAAQFAEALAETTFGAVSAGGTHAGAAQAGGARKSYALASWAAAAIALVTLVAGYVTGRSTAPVPEVTPVHFLITLPESVVQVNRCCGRAQALSPDGSTLVFVGIRTTKGMLYRRALSRLDAEPIPGTDDGATPFFSPDGKWLGFSTGDKIRKVAMSGGPSTPIVSADVGGGATWGDDDVIVYSEAGRLWTVPAAGGSRQAVPVVDTTATYLYPFALPGGKRALVTVRTANTALDGSRIGVLELATGGIDTIGFGARAEYASGHIVFSGTDNTLLVQPFDVSKRKTTGAATVLLAGVSLSGGTNHEFSLSANGWLEYMPGASSSSEVLRATGPAGRNIIALPGRSGDNLEDPAVSPDGRRIALRLGQLASGGAPDVWVLDRPQATLTRFTVGGGTTPVWSRDGRRIAYRVPADSGRGAGIYVRAADQSGAPVLVLGGLSVFPSSWLPGDRELVFTEARPGGAGFDIGIVTLGDSVPRWILKSEFSERNAQVSPDGRRLAFESNRTGKFEVYVQPMTGTAGAQPGAIVAATQISTEGGTSPRWSPDGRMLYYIEDGSIIGATLEAGPGVAVANRKPIVEGGVTDINGTNVNWDIFPDGKQFLYIDQVGANLPRIALIQNWPQMLTAMGAAPK
jgi:Tol biopolymer transport system component/tRNA A-37 threonylcarbamoyl transferase component Bud32